MKKNAGKHPTTRVLAVLELLQARGRMSGQELAERVGVDRRTVRRYMVQLEEMGIPITTERGPAGGYELVAGFKLPPLLFTADEVVAIGLGLAAVRGLDLTEAVGSAAAKLERVMPAELKGRMRAMGETVVFAGDPAGGVVNRRVMGVLSRAAHEGRGVRMGYRDPAGVESERGFDPYGLAMRGGHWYAVGYCQMRQALRTFRMDRIWRAELEGRRFARPDGFAVLQHLEVSLATLARRYSIRVWLETDLEGAQQEVFGAMGVLEPADGGVELRSQADDLDWFARELARLPWRFTVREPEELREAVWRLGRRLLGAGGDPGEGVRGGSDGFLGEER